MTQIDLLIDYRNPLISSLASIEEMRDKLDRRLIQLRVLYPSWRASPNSGLDVRPEYFMLLAVIVQNLRLSFMFMHDQLCDLRWWKRREARFFGRQLDDEAYKEALEGYQTMGRQYFTTQIASVTEHTLASIAMSGHGPFQLNSSGGFVNAYEYVLRRVSLLKKYQQLFDLLRLVRNTFHSNGTFSDPTGDTIKEYKGRRYKFQLGHAIRWDNDDMILMAEWMSDAMWEILNSPNVRSITSVPVN